MKGPGGSGEGTIDPPVGGVDGGRAAVRVDEVREGRGEDDTDGRVEELEAMNGALETRVAELEDELIEVRGALAGLERRHEIERAAVEAGALDAETVGVLTEIAVSAMEEPDVRAAVEALRRDKAFLFRGGAGRGRRSAGVRSSAMSASVERGGGGIVGELGELAEEARASGDRRALLAYLRQRRGG